MIKALEFEHDEFKAVVRRPKRIEKKDFSLELVRDLPFFDFRKRRYDEYSKLGFPVWKRLKLQGIEIPESLPKASLKATLDLTGDFDEKLIKKMDFEGTDRKYTLMAEIFGTNFLAGKLGENGKVEIEGDSIDNALFCVEGNSSLELLYKGNWRVSTMRFYVKSGVSFDLSCISFVRSLEIENIFFYLEAGASVNLKHFIIGEGKIASSVMVMGETESSFHGLPRVISKDGGVDLMYWFRTSSKNLMDVDGHGVSLKDGKIIFRGVMDIKKGATGGQYSEKFRTLLMDASSTFEAVPSLFVEENDLSASHGASSSPVPYDEVFYLMSRGFDQEEAKKMIGKGFIIDVADDVVGDLVDLIW